MIVASTAPTTMIATPETSIPVAIQCSAPSMASRTGPGSGLNPPAASAGERTRELLFQGILLLSVLVALVFLTVLLVEIARDGVGKVSGDPVSDAHHGGTFAGAEFTGDPARIV